MFTKSEFETKSVVLESQGRVEHVSRAIDNWESVKKAKCKKAMC